MAIVTNNTGSSKVNVRVSTDGGATWADADSGSNPTYAIGQICVYRIGDTLKIAYVVAGNTTTVKDFSLVTMTWGSAVTNGPVGVVTGINTISGVVALSNGDLVLLFEDTDTGGVTTRRVGCSVYSGGSWSSTTWLLQGSTESPARPYFFYSAAADASDVVYVFASYDLVRMRVATFTVSGGLLAVVKAPWRNTISFQLVYGGAATVSSLCSVNRAILPVLYDSFYNGSDSDASPGILMVEATSAPLSSVASQNGSITRIMTNAGGGAWSGDNYGKVALVIHDDTLYIYYNYLVVSGGVDQFSIRRACNRGGDWSAETTIYTPSADVTVRNLSAGTDGTDVGLTWETFTSSWEILYETDVAPTCSATACGSGGATSGNINSVRS
jgi:hypothetical protein